MFRRLLVLLFVVSLAATPTASFQKKTIDPHAVSCGSGAGNAPQRAATTPSLRGSLAPSIRPSGCQTIAPACPMNSSNGPVT